MIRNACAWLCLTIVVITAATLSAQFFLLRHRRFSQKMQLMQQRALHYRSYPMLLEHVRSAYYDIPRMCSRSGACYNDTHVFIDPSAEDACCFLPCANYSRKHCTCPAQKYRTTYAPLPSDWTDVVRFPGLALQWDSAVSNEQFGHCMVRLMQAWLLTRRKRFDILLAYRLPRFPKGTHLRTLWDAVLGKEFLQEQMWMADDIKALPHQVLCVDTAVEVGDYETFFFTSMHALMWRSWLTKTFGLVFPSKCPPPVAAVLTREHMRVRKRLILNYEIIGKVLSRVGITQYKNVTCRDDASFIDQVSVFQGFGLMISSHSSQLKNLVFASPGAIVIETKTGPVSDAFSRSTDQLGLFFVHSYPHIPTLPGVRDKDQDYLLNEV